jgi:hypothetical protein
MPVVNTTNTFTNNEQITSTKLNDIMDNSSFVSGAVVTSGGLEITAGGQMQIASDGVTTARILNSNVTTAKIADGAVTPAKLSTSGPSWDSAGGTFLLSQRVLEVGYGITSNTDSVIDFHAVHPLTDYEARIIRASGANGTFSISNNGTGAITLSSSGGVTFGSANMPTPVGTAPIFGVRAWVNFDASRDSSGATNASNTNRFIRSSGNVTSVLKTATGKFTVTFTFAMPNTNYIVTSSAGIAGSPRFACADRTTATTTSIEIETDDASGNAANFTENNVMVIA